MGGLCPATVSLWHQAPFQTEVLCHLSVGNSIILKKSLL